MSKVTDGSGAPPGRILVSFDAGWYHVGEPGEVSSAAKHFFRMGLLPTLQNAGISEGQIRDLISENSRNTLNRKSRLQQKDRAQSNTWIFKISPC